MFRVATPLWLAGLSALVVPLVIHLWSRRHARVVRIGSLRGLEGRPGPRALGRRIEDLPILLVRMGLLAAAVLGIAGLAARTGTRTAPGLHLVLVDPAALAADSLAVFSDPLVDSLRRAGEPLHLLAPGFPPLAAAGAARPPVTHAGHWDLLGVLADTLPAGSRVTVVGAPSAGSLGSGRPAFPVAVDYRLPGSRAWSVTAPGLGVARESDPLADRPVTEVSIHVVADQGDTSEGRMVLAAWATAVEALTGAEPTLHYHEGAASLEGIEHGDFLIWLAGQSVPISLLNRLDTGTTLVEFPSGANLQPASGVALPVATTAISAGTLTEPVYGLQGVADGTPFLALADGRPLLTLARRGRGMHYRVATRPDPAWSEWGAGSGLVELALLTARGGRTGAASAPVAPSQAAIAPGETTGLAADHWRPLAPAAWVIALLLLLVDRLVAFRRARAASGSA